MKSFIFNKECFFFTYHQEFVTVDEDHKNDMMSSMDELIDDYYLMFPFFEMNKTNINILLRSVSLLLFDVFLILVQSPSYFEDHFPYLYDLNIESWTSDK